MSTQTLTIQEFLEARWTEEETRVREALSPDFLGEKTFYDAPGGQRDSWGLWTYNVPPDRILADIAAKRAILAEHSYHLVASYDSHIKPIPGTERPRCNTCASQDENGADWPCDTVRLLAQPYRDHPDWRADW